MGVTDEKEAVKITDCVNDHRGTLIGWVDASNRTKNQEAYQPVFYEHKSTSKSWFLKFTTIGGKLLYKVFGEDAVNYSNIVISDTAYPRSAIEGFPNGVMFNEAQDTAGVPEKRVVLKHDIDGNAPFAEKYLPGSPKDSKRVTELEKEKQELRDEIDAMKANMSDLQVQVGEDDDTDNRGGTEELQILEDGFEEDEVY